MPEPKWEPPHVKVEWGSYFKPDPEEQAKIVKMCSEALSGNMVPLRTVVAKLAPIFGFDNVDAVVDAIEEEQVKRDDRELEKAAAEAESLHKLAGSIDGGSKPKPGSGARGGGNAPKATSSGSGGFGAASKASKGRP